MYCSFLAQRQPYSIWMVLFVIFFLNGCGGPGAGGDPMLCPGSPGCPEPDETIRSISDFAGTYELQGFSVEDIDINGQKTENDYDHWCGRMVITSPGQITLDMTLGGAQLSLRWEILSVMEDRLQLKRVPDPYQNYMDECVSWINYLFENNSLTLIFSQDSCIGITYMSLELFQTDTMEEYPPEDACMPIDGNDNGGSDNGGDDNGGIVPELAGNYEAITLSFLTGEEDADIELPEGDWTGLMTITSENVINFILTVEGVPVPFPYYSWQIVEILDGDGDGQMDSLRLTDKDSCELVASFRYNEAENILAFTWPVSDCMSGIGMEADFVRLN